MPSEFAPSLNVTVPVGVPAAAEVTVAVKVTICAKLEGFNEEANVVVEGATTVVMVQVWLSGVVSKLPAASIARTWKV